MVTRYEEARERAWAQVHGNLTPYTVELVGQAEQAIEYLMQHGGFTPLTKAEFALKLGWVTGPANNEQADRRLVEKVCNLTRDVEQSPDGYPDWVAAAIAGYVVAYAPNSGGMTLLGDGVDIDPRMFVHLLTGDLQKQQVTKTLMRRRLPTWIKCAEAFADSGQGAMAMVLAKGENEIATTGMVSDHIVGEIYKTAKALGVIDA